jgi:hypothetical protein
MSRRFPNGKVPRPANAAHRRDMCIDAVADLDMTALYALVCRFGATVEDITAAAEQTDRTADDVSAALAAWVRTDAADGLTARETGRLVNTLTQPSLELELS